MHSLHLSYSQVIRVKERTRTPTASKSARENFPGNLTNELAAMLIVPL